MTAPVTGRDLPTTASEPIGRVVVASEIEVGAQVVVEHLALRRPHR